MRRRKTGQSGELPGPGRPVMSDWQQGWLRRAQARPSPNHDRRPDGMAVELLVVHYISLPPGRFRGDAVERLFTNRLDPQAHPAFEPLRALRVSAHFLIRRDGRLLQFVDADLRAWHAGESRFLGRERCNDFSIGVELEGDGRHRFMASQYRELRDLVARLRQRYPLRWVAGHSDIAPLRKDDPGPFFDWRRLTCSREARGLIEPQAAARGLPGQ